jgi:glutamate formiminotransferase
MPIVETVPNFSEGRDARVVEQIVDCFRTQADVKLLDYSCDTDHNRMVVTAIGKPEAVKQATVRAIGVAVREIDLTRHQGVHPRMGAADVVPFIPLQNYAMADAVHLSREVAEEVSMRYSLPVYLYEQSATASHRVNLADVRRGGFEGLREKMQQLAWQPDYGAAQPHPTAGAAIIGARKPLIAFNVNLDTADVSLAQAIARKIRASNGGLPALKAMGVYLVKEGVAQVSMNLCDYEQTGICAAFEAVRTEAAARGTGIRNTELIGLVPQGALSAGATHCLPALKPAQIIESHL